MQSITIINATKSVTIGESIDLADTFSSRLFGLLGRRGLDSGRGMLIQPSSGVHTIGMTFPIDVVALDKHGQVLRTWSRLPPFRMTGLSFNTHACLELAAGQVDLCNIEAGDRLDIVSTPIHRRVYSVLAETPVAVTSSKGEVMASVAGVATTFHEGSRLPSGNATSMTLRLTRGIGLAAAGVVLLALAQWSPDGFAGLAAGSVTAGLAIIISGWR